MKKLVVLLLVMLTVNLGFSQSKPKDLIIDAGPELKTGKKEWIDKIVGKDESGIYVMAKYKDELTLTLYGHDLSVKKVNKVSLEYQKKDLVYRGLIQMGESFYLYTTYRDKKKKMTYLYSQELNKKSLTFSNPKELAHASYEGYKKRQSASYSFTVSADSNYLLFITDLPTGKGDKDRYGLMVFDQEMEELWSKKDIETPELDEDFYRYDVQMGKDGKVYLLAKIYEEGKAEKGAINYKFEMLVYSEDEDEEERFDVTLNDKHLSDVTFERLDNGDFNVIGFYADKGGIQDGVFNLLIDGESYSVSNEETVEFPTDFIVQHSSEKTKKKAAKKEAKGKAVALYSYDIDDLIENPDGTVTMIGEQYRFYQVCTTDANGNTTCTNHYVYGNIIIVKFNTDGEVEWMELIPKLQHTTNDGGYYSGYALTTLPTGDLRMVFNDNPKNNYYDQNGKYYEWRRKKNKTDIIMYEVNLEGRVKRYTLFNASDEEVMSRPKVSVQIDDTETIVLGESKKFTKFFKLKFDE